MQQQVLLLSLLLFLLYCLQMLPHLGAGGAGGAQDTLLLLNRRPAGSTGCGPPFTSGG
jgi:hypothetical protein